MNSDDGSRGRGRLVTSLLVLSLVLSLVLTAVAVGPAAATTVDATTVPSPVTSAAKTADTPTTDAVAASCTGVGTEPVVVATLPGASRFGPNDTVRVYRGTELVVELCNVVARLDATDAEGLTVLSESDDRLRLRVDGRVTVDGEALESDVGLGALAEPNPVPGPNLTVVDPSAEIELVDGSLAVPTREQASDLEDAEATYFERERTFRERLDALDGATTDVESGARTDGERFDAVYAAHDQYRDAYQALLAQLYDAAASDVGTARTATAIAELEARDAAVDERIDEQAGDYDVSLVERERSLTWALRNRILGLGALALLVGAGLGAALPFRRGRAARRQLRRGEWATYSRRIALYPAIVGAVLLLVGLGWFALRVGWFVLEVVT